MPENLTPRGQEIAERWKVGLHWKAGMLEPAGHAWQDIDYLLTENNCLRGALTRLTEVYRALYPELPADQYPASLQEALEVLTAPDAALQQEGEQPHE